MFDPSTQQNHRVHCWIATAIPGGHAKLCRIVGNGLVHHSRHCARDAQTTTSTVTYAPTNAPRI